MADVDLKDIMAEGEFLRRVGDELVGDPAVGPAGPTGPTGPTGPVQTTQTIEAVAATTYTIVAADAGKLKRLTGASCTVTLPSGSITTGQRADFACIGGIATFTLGAGATWDVTPTPSAVARAKGSFVSAIKTGATTWCLVGDLA